MDALREAGSLEPGLHVETVADPLAHASRRATEIDAELCTTADEVHALVAEREALPRVPADAVEDLVRLGARVAAARRVVERTTDRAAVEVGERLSGGSGLAIHPTAVRDRAAAAVTARRAATDAEERLQAHEETAARKADEAAAMQAAQAVEPEAPLAGRSRVDPTADEPPARRRRFSLLRRRRPERDEEDTSESTSLLQQVAASTDEAFGARRATAARDDQLVLLRAQRDRALEDLRVAERAWRDLAGEAPVEEVEVVVRRFDPQHEVALAVAQDTAGVRAVSALLDQTVQAWREAWQAAGGDLSAVADDAELETALARAVRPVVLVGPAAGHAELVTLAAPAAVVVAVEAAAGAS